MDKRGFFLTKYGARLGESLFSEFSRAARKLLKAFSNSQVQWKFSHEKSQTSPSINVTLEKTKFPSIPPHSKVHFGINFFCN